MQQNGRIVQGMVRVRSADSNVIEFPKGDQVRLESAIRAFDSSDQSSELLEEFRILAAKGLKEAHFFLGCIYEDGSNGVSRDQQSALRFYEESIEGFGYIEGYLGAARLLYHGEGIQQDCNRAFRYYEHVARNNGHPVACFMLGRLYQRGEGTAKDFKAARSWYDKAVSLGSVYGILNLAALEAEEGRTLRSLCLRVRAGINALAIARRDAKDIRLRGG